MLACCYSVKFAPISWVTCAQHVLDMCTSADVRVHNSCCATDKAISFNDITYIFKGLFLYVSKTYPICFNVFVPIVPLCHVALFIFPLARWHSGTSGTNSPIHLLQQLFLHFQLARHEAREKKVSLASKEGVLLSQTKNNLQHSLNL